MKHTLARSHARTHNCTHAYHDWQEIQQRHAVHGQARYGNGAKAASSCAHARSLACTNTRKHIPSLTPQSHHHLDICPITTLLRSHPLTNALSHAGYCMPSSQSGPEMQSRPRGKDSVRETRLGQHRYRSARGKARSPIAYERCRIRPRSDAVFAPDR